MAPQVKAAPEVAGANKTSMGRYNSYGTQMNHQADMFAAITEEPITHQGKVLLAKK